MLRDHAWRSPSESLDDPEIFMARASWNRIVPRIFGARRDTREYGNFDFADNSRTSRGRPQLRRAS